MLDTFGATLGKLADHVPPDVELYFSFSYGKVQSSPRGRANRHGGHGELRRTSWSCTRDRSDDAYFRAALHCGSS